MKPIVSALGILKLCLSKSPIEGAVMLEKVSVRETVGGFLQRQEYSKLKSRKWQNIFSGYEVTISHHVECACMAMVRVYISMCVSERERERELTDKASLRVRKSDIEVKGRLSTDNFFSLPSK